MKPPRQRPGRRRDGRGPRRLSREWFDDWLARHVEGIAFIDAHFNETGLRSDLAEAEAEGDARRALDLAEWLVMLLRRHDRHDQADTLLEDLGRLATLGRRPGPERKARRKPKPRRKPARDRQGQLF
jgi:hypothetical protein